MEKVFIGIDGGATTSTSCLLTAEGETIREKTSGPTNYYSIGFETALTNLINLYNATIKDFESREIVEFVALSGVDTEKDRLKWQQALEEMENITTLHNKITVGNDVLVALRAGTEKKDAVCIISGTGSAGYGTNRDGQTEKVDGMKQILSDEGSGYSIGLATLKEITKQLDGRSEKSKLLDICRKNLSFSTLEDLHDLVYRGTENDKWKKHEIASLASSVMEATRFHDKNAQQIIDRTVKELLLMTDTLVKKLSLSETSFDLVLAGGLLTAAPEVRNSFIEQVNRAYQQATIKEPTISYAHAAALIARETEQQS